MTDPDTPKSAPPSGETADAVKAAGAGAATHLFFLCLVGFVVAIGVWMAQAKIDAVAITEGEVVPSSSIQSIQHLEGGIVRELLVRENDEVAAGDPLVILENTASNADLEELTVRETALRLRIARLEAESAGADAPEVPADLQESATARVEEMRALFQARRTRLEAELVRARQIIEQRRRDIEEIEARIASNTESLRLADEQIQLSASLLRDNLTTRFNHLQFVRDGETIRGKLAEDAAVLERAKSKLSEAETEIGAIQSTYDSDVRQTLEEARGELQELAERRRKFEDTLGRTVLRAPVDGIVKSQYFFTVGGVIRPGEVVLDLVPKDDRLVIEAKLMPQDVSYVFPGQTAVIRLASQEALRFGIIEGSVSEVSPDALSDDQGVPYFEVRILTEQDHFERDGQHYSLFPGMQVTAGIHTHSRTIFEYLAAPFMDGLDVALGER